MPIELQVLQYTVFNLTKALLAPNQQDSFLYWPFLLSTLVIGLLAWGFWQGGWNPASLASFRANILSAKLWWHRSARADYRLYFLNALILPLLFSYTLLDHLALAARLEQWLGLPLVPNEPLPAPAWILTFTLLFFVAYDFGRYLAHFLLHRLPWLWAFHKVHHSAQVLTPMTAFRAHPVDLLVMAWGSTILTGPLFLAFKHLAGVAVPFYVFMGLHVLMWVGNLIGNLRHSPIWLTYGPVLGKWLISPAHHQIHHSTAPRHWGKNIGFELAIWDRLFGTLYLPSGPAEDFRLGLEDQQDPRWQTVRHMLFAPFAEIVRTPKPNSTAKQSAENSSL